MNNSSLHILKVVPVWRIYVYLFLSIFLTFVTLHIVHLLYWGLYTTSSTFHALQDGFSDSYGPGHADDLFTNLRYVFMFFLFLGYLFLCYRYEKKQYYYQYFHRILHELKNSGGMNDTDEIMVIPHTPLGELAKGINDIIKKLKDAINEERRIEQTKKELITSVAHDLRTPLTSIIGYLTYIQQDRYRDEIELRYYIEIVYEKAIRLNHLIQDLFEYNHLQNKSLEFKKTSIDINEMLNQLVVQFQPEIQKADMKFRQSTSVKKLVVFADGDKLFRVFENLITNAMKYGKSGKYIDILAREEKHVVVIDIINYGENIPSIDIPYIFDRFYRVEKSRSVQTGGSGLGLAIAKSIVELHDGTIEVSSDVEQTIFTVKLNVLTGSVATISKV
ncbi:sensor histidine kinase [Bacillus wiedmannii]|uniref:sensor histidine kinase n=1 Tax=Bacillus wiedmannii TaxID=1890302 RepID=UPI000BEDDFB5|nr:HAMP domain-containing sensor histidine kinase [Bacillus wiedmannii]PEF42566.1 two-component sensor histidine kinase [Bacillus wiedmannii]